MSVVADAYLRMERCNCISPRRRDGVTRSNRPGWARVGHRSKPDRRHRTQLHGLEPTALWGASFPTTDCCQSMRAVFRRTLHAAFANAYEAVVNWLHLVTLPF